MDKKRVYRQYGKAEEKVKIISDHGSVLIVENKAGNRFPVENTDIKILNDDKAKKKVQVDIDAD